jgi:hypothetical protein
MLLATLEYTKCRVERVSVKAPDLLYVWAMQPTDPDDGCGDAVPRQAVPLTSVLPVELHNTHHIALIAGWYVAVAC